MSHPRLIPHGTIPDFLASTDVLDWHDPAVLRQARDLAEQTGRPDDLPLLARLAFEFVRDQIPHSYDSRATTVTCSASETLAARTGFCYAKSHLLASLLRANGIPAGLCYQRLSFDDAGPPFSLHGLVAVLLPDHGWYRVDPRGNRPGIDAQFAPPTERLAFTPRLPGESDSPDIWPDPDPLVLTHLRRHTTCQSLVQDLPDRPLP